MKLAAKLVLVFMVGIVAVTIFHAYLLVRREAEIFEQETSDEARLIGDAIDDRIIAVWKEAGQAAAMHVIETADQREPEMRIRWVWFDAGPSDAYRPAVPPEAIRPTALEGHPPVKAQHPDGTAHLHTYWPVAVEQFREGGLEFSRPMLTLKSQNRETILRTLALMGTMVLVTGVLMTFVGMQVVGRPLKLLIQKTRRIASGDLAGPVGLGSHDELGELAASVDDMCSKLVASAENVRRETAARIAAMEQLRHADRLKTVGRLASGVAHELGTPLNVISGRASLIASGRLSAEEVASSARTIKSEAERMTRIIRQLLDFARPNTPHWVDADLRQIVRQTIELLAPAAQKQNVTLALNGQADGRTVQVDVGQIQQLVTNLVMNAIQAMPEGGRVNVGIHPARARPPAGHDAAEGDYFRIDVRDEGKGIAEADLAHVFEPFFSTKEVGQGTGLGLSISHGIVLEHGGWIDVTSQPDKGSCFSAYLPRGGTNA